MLEIAPDGAGVVLSNVGPEGLADMAELLAGIAVEAAARRPDNEPRANTACEGGVPIS
jgi:hypothetical protein